MKIEQIKYGLLYNNKLLRYESYSSNGEYSHGYIYRLINTNNEDNPNWLVDNLEDVSKTLFKDIGWRNSQKNRPCWGDIDIREIKVVKVVTITEITKIEMIC